MDMILVLRSPERINDFRRFKFLGYFRGVKIDFISPHLLETDSKPNCRLLWVYSYNDVLIDRLLRLVKMNMKLFIGWKNLEVGNNVITGIKITFHRIHYHQPVPNNYGKWLRSSPFGKPFKHRCDIKNWEKSQASEFLLLSSRIFIWLSMWLWKENGNRMKCEFWGIEEMLSFLSKEWDNTSKAILHQVLSESFTNIFR